jgi:flagellar FliL protein
MAKKDKDAPVEGAEAPKSKKKLVVIIALVVALLGGGGGYYFFFMGGEEPPPTAGAVVRLDPVNINLAGGHYLKVGLALQVIEGPAHEPDGAHALDIMIGKLSHRTIAELSSNPAREKVKKELLHDIEEAYHHDVMDIYFTEFVMQ